MALLTQGDDTFIEATLVMGSSPNRVLDVLLRSCGSVSAMYRRCRKYRLYGNVFGPKGSPERPRLVTIEMRDAVVDAVARKGTIWLEELHVMLAIGIAKWISGQAIGRVMHDASFTKKVTTCRATQQDPKDRMRFEGELHSYGEDQLVFVDEPYASENYAVRRHGWSPMGFTCVNWQHLRHAQRHNIVP